MLQGNSIEIVSTMQSQRMKSKRTSQSTINVPLVVGWVVTIHILGVAAVIIPQSCRGPETSVSEISDQPIASAPESGEAEAPESSEPGELETHTYVVEPGDTLSSIAQKHDVRQRKLLDLNELSNPDTLRVGQKLVIPRMSQAPDSGHSGVEKDRQGEET